MGNEKRWSNWEQSAAGRFRKDASSLIDALRTSEAERIQDRLRAEPAPPSSSYVGPAMAAALLETPASYGPRERSSLGGVLPPSVPPAPQQAAPRAGPVNSRLEAVYQDALAALPARLGKEGPDGIYDAQMLALDAGVLSGAIMDARELNKGGASWVAGLSAPAGSAVQLQALADAAAYADKTAININPILERAGLPPMTPQQMFGGGGGTGARIDTNAQDAAIWDTKSRQAEFDNKMAQYDRKVAFDDLSVRRAATDIARSAKGLEESRLRADLITDNLIKTAPYNTGGRTSFSGTDLGAITEMKMRQAGFNNPQAITNLVNYPSNVVVDTPGLMAAADEQFGVQGRLPDVPRLSNSQPGQIPGAPPITAFVPTQFIPGTAGMAGGYNPFVGGGMPQQAPIDPYAGPTPGIRIAPPSQWEDNTAW